MADTAVSGDSYHLHLPSSPIRMLNVSSRYSKMPDYSSSRASNLSSSMDSEKLVATALDGNSPVDLLINAIQEGNASAVQSIVRSRGLNLKAKYWTNVSVPIMPLHRAITGLHHHGSEQRVISTLSVLLQLGAEINYIDSSGNSVLHHVIKVCTSKSICAVLELLLVQGANPNHLDFDKGESPLHLECRCLRDASPDILTMLLGSGAKPNLRRHTVVNSQKKELAFTSLTTLLVNIPKPLDKARGCGSRTWIRCLQILVKGGAKWEPSFICCPKKRATQLNLLLDLFPPTPNDITAFVELLCDAVDGGFDLYQVNARGHSPLYQLCERLGATPMQDCPEASRVLQTLLAFYDTRGVGSAAVNRDGQSLTDIRPTVNKSCLSFCRGALTSALSSPSLIKSGPQGPS